MANEKTPRETALVKAAKVRAACIAMLNNQATILTIDEIFSNLDAGGKIKVTRSSLASILKDLASNRQILEKKVDNKLYYAPVNGELVDLDNKPVKVKKSSGVPDIGLVWDEKARVLHISTPDFNLSFSKK